MIFTVGRVSGDRPLPLTSKKFRRKFEVPLNTRNRPIEDLSAGAGIVTSVQRFRLPVDGTVAVPRSAPSGPSLRSSIEPPAVVEATRNVIESMPVKLTGSKEAQSPVLRPVSAEVPSASPPASAVSVPRLPSACSASLRLGCRITVSVPVSAGTSPSPLSV